VQYSTTFCFSFARSFPLLHFRQSLCLRSRLLRFCCANPCAFAHGCCASALPIPAPSLTAVALLLCQSLRLHSQFSARNPYEVSSPENFRSVLGIGMVTWLWTRCMVEIAQNSIFAQQRFSNLKSARDVAAARRRRRERTEVRD